MRRPSWGSGAIDPVDSCRRTGASYGTAVTCGGAPAAVRPEVLGKALDLPSQVLRAVVVLEKAPEGGPKQAEVDVQPTRSGRHCRFSVSAAVGTLINWTAPGANPCQQGSRRTPVAQTGEPLNKLRRRDVERVDYESVVVQDLLNFHSRGELNISPWYQRRSVWKVTQKAYLINTIHERKPVPSVYIRHTIDLENEKSIKEVVDGQQRIRCLIEYRDDIFAASHPAHRNPVRFSTLEPAQKRQFLLTSISVGYLVGAEDRDVIEIFARINSVAKTLNPQEKRNAQYSGAFKQFCLNESIDRLPIWRTYGIFTDNDISRMIEVQFVSDLVVNLLGGLQDFSAKTIDSYYERYDEQFPNEDELKLRLERLFSVIVDIPVDLLKGTVFARPQVLFSLLLVIDDLRTVPHDRIKACITDLDAKIEAVRSGDFPDAVRTDVYEAFTTGNMHRIRFRRKRAEVIRDYLS